MEDAQPALLWRWEVKKLGSLAAEKAHATAVRAWFKQVRCYTVVNACLSRACLARFESCSSCARCSFTDVLFVKQ